MQPTPGHGPTAGPVLIVDDDLTIRQTVGELLEGAGYEVQLAENGAIALDLCRQRNKPSLVLLDMMMPVMSGFELLELLEDGDVDLNQVPIVVLSAFTFPPSAADSKGGIKACLNKPVKAALLLQTVATYFRRQLG